MSPTPTPTPTPSPPHPARPPVPDEVRARLRAPAWRRELAALRGAAPDPDRAAPKRRGES